MRKFFLGLVFIFALYVCRCSYASKDVSGVIDVNTTWDLAGSPYIVSGAIIVNPNVTLTIEPGVVIKFEYTTGTYRGRLIVDGILDLQSTPANPIVFTSSKDDSYDGDSNVDGDAIVPAKGDWGFIKINNSSNVLHDCIIRYGGYTAHEGVWRNYMIWVDGGSPIRNSGK